MLFLLSDDFDPDLMFDCLTLKAGNIEPSKNILTGLLSKINKAHQMLNSIRGIGHDLDDDYIVNLDFFDLD